MRNQFDFYKEYFGPVMAKFIYKLHQYISYLDDGETIFLYATRAGYRIKKLYETMYPHMKTDKKHRLFLTSRFIVAKSFLTSHREIVSQLLADEYRYKTVEDFIQGVTRQDKSVDYNAFNDPLYANINAVEFIENFDKSIHYRLYDYLDSEHNKYDTYFKELIERNKRVVIIDSGWSGTIQRLLMKLYPKLEFYGLYFGKIIPAQPDWYVLQRMKGLMFEGNYNDGFNTLNDLHLESSFLVHRHLIEDLFEPSFSTIEHIGNPSEMQLIDNEDDRFKGVKTYLQDLKKDFERYSILEICNSSDKAMRIIKDMILYPEDDAIALFGDLERSFDFGKKGSIKVLLDTQSRSFDDSKKKRIKDAIWSQGQIYIEYKTSLPLDVIKEVQKQNLNVIEFALPKEPTNYKKPKVAVITRTMDREILLKRAKESIEKQTFSDYVWVIVNDSGDIEPVLRIAKEAIIDPLRIKIVHNYVNIGMEASSNRAISTTDSEYIVIHDDDDSWDARFLEKTVSFLESDKGRKYGAVITDTIYVSESISNNTVTIHEQRPYNDWVYNVHLAEMVQGNFFAPICFLFKREIYNKLEGFDESLPVLGDWDFNLRYLLEADIGVLKEPLAYYHHRDRNDGTISSTYSNSVIGGVSKHIEYNSVVRNKFIRKNQKIFGVLIANGYVHQDMRNRTDNLVHHQNKIQNDIAQKMDYLTEKVIKSTQEEITKSVGWLRNEVLEHTKQETTKSTG